ncbi:MAG TPA: PAS domain-containing protein [Planctomycetota bacterium]|nr:PAS domain-containing protein [Planctomycetota bacterium]
MDPPVKSPSELINRQVVVLAGGYALIGGLVTLIGWVIGSDRLKDWVSAGVTMKANAAICAASLGLSILCLVQFRQRGLARFCASLPIAIGLLTLLEHLFNVNFGIDTLLFDEAAGSGATAAPGRMGPPASASYTLIGIALLGASGGQKGRRTGAILALVTLAISTLSLIGYIFRAEPLYMLPHLTGIAFQTASIIASLSIAVCALIPDAGIAHALTGNDLGALMFRRLLPPIIIVSIIVGWLRLQGQYLELYDIAFGTAARTLLELILLVGLLWITALSLRRVDMDRRQVQDAFESASAELQQILDTAAVGLVRNSRDLRYISVNAAYARIAGLDVNQIVGKRLPEVMGTEAYELIRPYVERVLNGERVEYQIELPWSAGGRKYIHVVYTPWRDANGAVTGWVASVFDITERMTAEKARQVSEQRLLLFIEHAPAGIAMLDRDMKYLAASRRWKLDYDLPEELTGRSHYELFPNLPEHWRQAHSRGLAGEVLSADEDPFVRKDGTTQWIKWEIRPWHEANGSIGGIMISAEDVSARVHAQEKLRKSEEYFRTLADNISQLAWMADRDGALFWYNKRWYEFTGSTPEQMHASGWQTLLHAEHLGRVLSHWQTARNSGEPWEDTFPLRSSTGEYRWFLSRALPIRDDSGSILLWFGTNTDITDLRQAQEALKESDARKDAFITMLAHELRNPLSPIRNAAEIITRTSDSSEPVIRAATIISRQVSHMSRLIDDLLDISRITRGKLELKTEPVNLAYLLQTVIDDYRPAIELAGLSVTFARPESGCNVIADRTRLAQVFSNLIHNSTKFTPSGGEINVELICNESEVLIQMRDTGIGIEPGFLQHMFEPFVQADKSLDRSKGGLGLGLALAKGIIDLHDGKIEVKSGGKGGGSEFTITLARTNAVVPPAERKSEVIQFTEPLKILVIEDNEDVSETTKMMLELSGHIVRTAASAAEGITAFDEVRPDVIICDIGLPDMSGMDVARSIRAKAGRNGVILIALTGYGQADDVRKSIEAGFDIHFTKPVDPDKLINYLAGLPIFKRIPSTAQ